MTIGRALAAGLSLVALTLVMSACTTNPPRNPDNICSIFEQHRSWYKAAEASRKRWGLPVHVGLAFIHRESSYIANAKPPRSKLMGFIPWTRPSSAYGYAQATDEAWQDYRRATGVWFADRDDFDDAIDFIGWYNNRTHKRFKMPMTDAYRLYLAYYSGPTGYARGYWRKDDNVKRYAAKVRDRAERYRKQLPRCEAELKRRRWFW